MDGHVINQIRFRADTTFVAMNEVSIVFWPPRSNTRYLAAEELNSCTAIGILSPTAAILAHIAPRESGTQRQATTATSNPGMRNLRDKSTEIRSLHSQNRAHFENEQTFVLAATYQGQPALADSVRWINTALTTMLQIRRVLWKSYPVLEPGTTREAGQTSVVIGCSGVGVLPTVFVNNTCIYRGAMAGAQVERRVETAEEAGDDNDDEEEEEEDDGEEEEEDQRTNTSRPDYSAAMNTLITRGYTRERAVALIRARLTRH